MKQESVVFKGTKEGIIIHLPDKKDFKEILSILDKKIKKARSFFSGAHVVLNFSKRIPSPEEERILRRLINNKYGMVLTKIVTPVAEKNLLKIKHEKAKEQPLVLRKTIRSGQKVCHDSTLIVLGDVNPGAELVANGDIFVLGCLRGIAHAGASGNLESIVAAFRLQPTQLRIGNILARAPDEETLVPEIPEIARVKDGTIIIEPYTNLFKEGIQWEK